MSNPQLIDLSEARVDEGSIARDFFYFQVYFAPDGIWVASEAPGPLPQLPRVCVEEKFRREPELNQRKTILAVGPGSKSIFLVECPDEDSTLISRVDLASGIETVFPVIPDDIFSKFEDGNYDEVATVSHAGHLMLESTDSRYWFFEPSGNLLELPERFPGGLRPGQGPNASPTWPPALSLAGFLDQWAVSSGSSIHVLDYKGRYLRKIAPADDWPALGRDDMEHWHLQYDRAGRLWGQSRRWIVIYSSAGELQAVAKCEPGPTEREWLDQNGRLWSFNHGGLERPYRVYSLPGFSTVEGAAK